MSSEVPGSSLNTPTHNLYSTTQCTSSLLRNTVVEPKQEPKTASKTFPKPFSPEWTLRRIRKDPEDHALLALKSLVHKKRTQEATLEILRNISQLDDTTALEALHSLQKPKQYIRGSRGQQLDLLAQLTTLENQCTFKVKTLLDSGYTSSCIDRDFV